MPVLQKVLVAQICRYSSPGTVLVLLGALIGLVLSPASPTAAQELTNIKISVDYRLYGANSPMWFAQANGLFSEAGINATVDGSSGSGDAINRVANGAYDAAYADVGTLAEFWARNPAACGEELQFRRLHLGKISINCQYCQ